MVFLRSYRVATPGGRSRGTESKKRSNFCLKKWLRSLRNLSSGRLRESFYKQYLTEKQNGYFQNVRLRQVVAHEPGEGDLLGILGGCAARFSKSSPYRVFSLTWPASYAFA